MSEAVKVHVPLHFTNEHTSVGGKKGGIAAHSLADVEVSCLPTVLPEFIEVDLGEMEAGQTIHLSEIKQPKGVEFVKLTHGDDAAVASVTKPRGAAADEEEEKPAEPAA